MKKAWVLIPASLVALPHAANSELLEGRCDRLPDVSITCDTATSLEWLDLAQTDGFSVNDFLADQGGYLSAGWQLASAELWAELMLNAGAVDLTGTSDPGNAPAIQRIFELFGKSKPSRDLTGGLVALEPYGAVFNSVAGPGNPFVPNSVCSYYYCGGRTGPDVGLPEYGVWLYRQGNLAIEVSIDIKPGSYPNCFNINGHGVIPVAILGSAAFDPATVDRTSVLFGGLDVRVRGNRGPLCDLTDSNNDGHLDLVCHFEDESSNWEPGEDEGTLSGTTTDGVAIRGSDSICVVP